MMGEIEKKFRNYVRELSSISLDGAIIYILGRYPISREEAERIAESVFRDFHERGEGIYYTILGGAPVFEYKGDVKEK
ncbi:MAG: hypothetical protein QW040_02495 [Candidatus Aenigmatarchaeota archaeon]